MSKRAKLLNESRVWLTDIDKVLEEVSSSASSRAVDRLFANPEIPPEDIQVSRKEIIVNGERRMSAFWTLEGEAYSPPYNHANCSCPRDPSHHNLLDCHLAVTKDLWFRPRFGPTPKNVDAARYQYEVTGVCVHRVTMILDKGRLKYTEDCFVCGTDHGRPAKVPEYTNASDVYNRIRRRSRGRGRVRVVSS